MDGLWESGTLESRKVGKIILVKGKNIKKIGEVGK